MATFTLILLWLATIAITANDWPMCSEKRRTKAILFRLIDTAILTALLGVAIVSLYT